MAGSSKGGSGLLDKSHEGQILLETWGAAGSELAEEAHKGFEFGVLEKLAPVMGFSALQLAGWLRLPETTFYRRQKQGRLSPEESNRLYELAALFRLARRVLGNQEEARLWLLRPAMALGGRLPLEYAQTAPGRDTVRRLLEQIEEGSYL